MRRRRPRTVSGTGSSRRARARGGRPALHRSPGPADDNLGDHDCGGCPYQPGLIAPKPVVRAVYACPRWHGGGWDCGRHRPAEAGPCPLVHLRPSAFRPMLLPPTRRKPPHRRPSRPPSPCARRSQARGPASPRLRADQDWIERPIDGAPATNSLPSRRGHLQFTILRLGRESTHAPWAIMATPMDGAARRGHWGSG